MIVALLLGFQVERTRYNVHFVACFYNAAFQYHLSTFQQVLFIFSSHAKVKASFGTTKVNSSAHNMRVSSLQCQNLYRGGLRAGFWGKGGMFGPKVEKVNSFVMRGFHILQQSPLVTRIMTYRSISWACSIHGSGKKRIQKPDLGKTGNGRLVTPIRTYKYNTKMNLQNKDRQWTGSIWLSQNRCKWWDILNMTTRFEVPNSSGNGDRRVLGCDVYVGLRCCQRFEG